MPQTQWSSIYIAPRDPALCQKRRIPVLVHQMPKNNCRTTCFGFIPYEQGDLGPRRKRRVVGGRALPMPGHKLPASLGMVRTPAVRLPEHLTLPPHCGKQLQKEQQVQRLDDVKRFWLLLSSTKCYPATPQHHSELHWPYAIPQCQRQHSDYQLATKKRT